MYDSTKSIHLYNIQIFIEGVHKDLKSSQDITSEKASTGSEEVFTSVRFAKKVVIQNSSTVGQSQVIIQIYDIKILYVLCNFLCNRNLQVLK